MEFVDNLLAGADESLVAAFEEEIEKLIAHPSLSEDTGATRTICRQWDDFCHRFFHAYQDLAVKEVSGGK